MSSVCQESDTSSYVTSQEHEKELNALHRYSGQVLQARNCIESKIVEILPLKITPQSFFNIFIIYYNFFYKCFFNKSMIAKRGNQQSQILYYCRHLEQDWFSLLATQARTPIALSQCIMVPPVNRRKTCSSQDPCITCLWAGCGCSKISMCGLMQKIYYKSQ